MSRAGRIAARTYGSVYTLLGQVRRVGKMVECHSTQQHAHQRQQKQQLDSPHANLRRYYEMRLNDETERERVTPVGALLALSVGVEWQCYYNGRRPAGNTERAPVRCYAI